MAQKFTIAIERLHVVMALGLVKKYVKPGAFLFGKLESKISSLLEAFPTATKFQLTAEAIDERDSKDVDRESEEERVEGQTHYR